MRAAVALCGGWVALAAMPARALDPQTALANYGFQSWQTDSGLPQNTVHAIVQGRDGFLWIATEGGLVRFDGVAFAVLTHANTPQLPSDLIDGLMEGRDGSLWVSTSGGLARVKDGRVEMSAEGVKEELEAFLEAIRQSEVGRFIRQEQTCWSEATNQFRGFEITH